MIVTRAYKCSKNIYQHYVLLVPYIHIHMHICMYVCARTCVCVYIYISFGEKGLESIAIASVDRTVKVFRVVGVTTA